MDPAETGTLHLFGRKQEERKRHVCGVEQEGVSFLRTGENFGGESRGGDTGQCEPRGSTGIGTRTTEEVG